MSACGCWRATTRTYFALAAGTAGLVSQDRRNAAVETVTNLVMCRIHNELRRRLTTDFAWVLEDDLIPRRPNQLERMLRSFRADVATVSAPYLSRYDPDYVAWRKDTAGKNCRIKRGSGVEQIVGSGFGCLLMRREVLDSYVFQIPHGERWYDPVFFDTAVAPRGRSLTDWELECEHVGVRRGET